MPDTGTPSAVLPAGGTAAIAKDLLEEACASPFALGSTLLLFPVKEATTSIQSILCFYSSNFIPTLLMFIFFSCSTSISLLLPAEIHKSPILKQRFQPFTFSLPQQQPRCWHVRSSHFMCWALTSLIFLTPFLPGIVFFNVSFNFQSGFP